MNTRKLIVAAGASLAVAACGGGGGGGGGALGPTSVSVPAWVTTGAPISALSANIADGTSRGRVDITFNANGSLTFTVNGDSFSVTNDDIALSNSAAFGDIFFFSANAAANGGIPDYVELVVVDIPTEEDIIAVARLDRFNTPLGYETAAVIGDLTTPTRLPSGSGVSYTGFMVGSLLVGGEVYDVNGDGQLDEQYDFVTADSQVTANFTTGNVGVSFNNFIAVVPGGGTIALPGSSMSGSASIATNTSVYGGPISGTIVDQLGTPISLDGAVLGGFYGANGEATAGVFDTNQTGGNAEFVGHYAASQ